jgi:hypothetical protein
MSAASRNVQAIPGTRQMGAALFAAVLAIALVALLAFSQLTGTRTQTGPAAGTAPAQWDHGTASLSAAGTAQAQWDHGTASLSVAAGPKTTLYTGIPYTPSRQSAAGPSTLYTGIPYTPSRHSVIGRSSGLRLAQ